MDKKRLIIIDSNAIIHRAYHALPPLTTKKGELINAIYGFLLFFLKAVREFKPDFIVAAFDLPGLTFRHKKYKLYKATRKKTPDELCQQISKVKEILKAFDIQVFEKEGFEADDVIGTVSKGVPSEIETIILTGDLDILQLVDKNTKAYTLKRGVKDAVLYDEEKVKERYGGLTPQQLIDFKSLRGDPSDNIPGVSGVGEKTAIALIKEFGSLGNLYQEINKNSPKAKKIKDSLKKKLLDYKKQAFLSKTLVEINQQALTEFNLENCRWGEYNKEKVIEILDNYGFQSLIKRLPEFKKEGYNKEKEVTKPGKEEENKKNLSLW